MTKIDLINKLLEVTRDKKLKWRKDSRGFYCAYAGGKWSIVNVDTTLVHHCTTFKITLSFRGQYIDSYDGCKYLRGCVWKESNSGNVLVSVLFKMVEDIWTAEKTAKENNKREKLFARAWNGLMKL